MFKVHLPKKEFLLVLCKLFKKSEKYAFYVILKTLFVLEIFSFLFKLFGYVEKRVDKKAWLILKFMTSQTEQETIHIFPNISRSKDNKKMKIVQLIEYNMRKHFLKYHAQNEVEKLVLDPFIILSLYQQSEML